MEHTFSSRHRRFVPDAAFTGTVAFYGGTFDPIHRAHLYVIAQVRATLKPDALVVIPTAQPPHKRKGQAERTAAHHRWAMVDLALPEGEDVYLSDYEIAADRPTYTVDLLEDMHARMPQAELLYVMGGDSFRDLPLWYRPDRIAELAHLVVVTRPDVDADVLAERRAAHEAAGGRVTFIPCEGILESSTALRSADDLSGRVPDAVLAYIEQHHLYER